jgi:hypothetical protein
MTNLALQGGFDPATISRATSLSFSSSSISNGRRRRSNSRANCQTNDSRSHRGDVALTTHRPSVSALNLQELGV